MRNAEATKEKILEAAMAEFSAYGIAGARVDRIAKMAKCNKNMIYIYFENKEQLFLTVLEMHLTRVYEEFDFTPEDLPGYAAQVFDFMMANPDLMRLMTWFSLEQKTGHLDQRKEAHNRKIAELAKAQAAGHIGTDFSPAFLLTSIMVLATAWMPTNPFGPSIDPASAGKTDELREAIKSAVGRLAGGTATQENR
ncbi:TetR family transcriptional regulator [Paenibacillus sp. XY044]|uniref:TetR family transcriptional regulator n=1 Tax=Paenibacillus sp. XY044 TaxID=2026089 RepID=UPI000B98ACD0|nr:TetR family transcriptional regulator [Paenibacillus sp. XY044]OZB91252.1 TetR family transcriptional regulator [Paenibacillus sp. XY044]